jgi:hypothetical protein
LLKRIRLAYAGAPLNAIEHVSRQTENGQGARKPKQRETRLGMLIPSVRQLRKRKLRSGDGHARKREIS